MGENDRSGAFRIECRQSGNSCLALIHSGRKLARRFHEVRREAQREAADASSEINCVKMRRIPDQRRGEICDSSGLLEYK